MTIKLKKMSLLVLITLFFACGDNKVSIVPDNSDARIFSLDVSTRLITSDAIATLDIEFKPATSTEVDFNPADGFPAATVTRAFELLIRLPRGLDFIEKSSLLVETYSSAPNFSNGALRAPDVIDFCPSGSRYLRYEFKNRELSSSDPLIAALRIKLRAIASNSDAQIGVATTKSFSDSCTAPLDRKVTVELE